MESDTSLLWAHGKKKRQKHNNEISAHYFNFNKKKFRACLFRGIAHLARYTCSQFPILARNLLIKKTSRTQKRSKFGQAAIQLN